MNTPDGKSAFPLGDMRGVPAEGGMTLRDYFAAKAMQGMAAREIPGTPKEFAEAAYRIAEAMLIERNQ